MSTHHAALVVEVFDHFTAAHSKLTDPVEKDTLKYIGVCMYDAMRKSAVYSMSRDLTYVCDFRDKDNWEALRACLKNNTQAVFNKGDGGKEDNIICLLTTTYPPENNEPALFVDTFVMFMWSGTKIHAVSASITRGSDRIRFLPMLILDIQEPGANLKEWFFSDVTAPEEMTMVGTVYLGLLTYLDAQLSVEASTGKYGDAMKYMSIMVTDILTGVPEWLREEAPSQRRSRG